MSAMSASTPIMPNRISWKLMFDGVAARGAGVTGRVGVGVGTGVGVAGVTIRTSAASE